MADCPPNPDGYLVLGMQNGEEVATTLRLVALCISISVFFPWMDPKRRGHMRIFFLHWASGVMYVLSQFILSVMVLNCWTSKREAGPVIFLIKFWELAVLNLWSISSLAIAVLIAIIVQSFSKLRRVPSVIGSARAAYGCVAASLLITVLSASFWNDILVTGGYFWVTNSDVRSHARWITLSFGATQTVAGMLMAVAVLFTLIGERRASLIVCCKTNQRVYFQYILTIFGTCVYVYNGVVLLVDEFTDFRISKRLVIIGWCSRYVHVIADTAIIFGAFHALMKKERDESQGIAYNGHGSGGTTSNTGGITTFTPLPIRRPPPASSMPREHPSGFSSNCSISSSIGHSKSTPDLTPASSLPTRVMKGGYSGTGGTLKPVLTSSTASHEGRVTIRSSQTSSVSSFSSAHGINSVNSSSSKGTEGQKLFTGGSARWLNSSLPSSGRA